MAVGIRTHLQLFNFPRGTVIAVQYRQDIIAHVRQFLLAIGPDCVFMKNNARLHEARIASQSLKSETLLRTEWSSRSSDLNCIEHV